MKGQISIMNNCVFCIENRFSLNRIAGLPTDNSVIYQDENIYVCPDLSPLKLGHVLIITKNHFTNFASTNDNVLVSLQLAKDYILSNKYYSNGYIVFEHGSHRGGSSIEHSHMHIVPSSVLMLDKVRHELIGMRKLEGEMDCLQTHIEQSYLYINESGFGEKVFIVDNLPAQFMRKTINGNKYDWRIMYTMCESKDIFIETLNMFSK